MNTNRLIAREGLLLIALVCTLLGVIRIQAYKNLIYDRFIYDPMGNYIISQETELKIQTVCKGNVDCIIKSRTELVERRVNHTAFLLPFFVFYLIRFVCWAIKILKKVKKENEI
jgi:hypothetical protein